MKFLNKKIEINADGESYQRGYIVELTKLEVALLKKSLELAAETEDFCQEYRDLAKKLEQLDYLAAKGFTNYEL